MNGAVTRAADTRTITCSRTITTETTCMVIECTKGEDSIIMEIVEVIEEVMI